MRELVLLLFASLLLASSVDQKIKTTATQIDKNEKTEQELNKKMSDTADAILKHKRSLAEQEALIKEIEEELEQKQDTHKQNLEYLASLREVKNELESQKKALQEELLETISKIVSISVVLEKKYAPSKESIVEEEVLSAMLREAKIQIKDLNIKYVQESKNIEQIADESKKLKKSIDEIESKKSKLVKTKEANQKLIVTMQNDVKKYKKELSSVLNTQDELKDTLSKLNIIKIDEQKKAEELARRQEAFSGEAAVSSSSLPDVKKKGSSYQAVKTKLYSGAKTIPPFNPYTITKSYGTYTDPIYNIKVFNESITMSSKESDTKVSTVFNGKVIYADKTAVLNNIVIVEHDNALHTIYANLSQIAPDIKKGARVKKGAIIGRIDRELIFEATQHSTHINPIRLFE